MMSIKHLFEETSNESKNDLNDSLQKLNLTLEDIPNLPPPKQGSKEHLEDLATVKHYLLNPTFAPNFLELSDKKAEKVFKMYLDQSGIDYDKKKIKQLCKTFDDVVMYLKNLYRRPRPKYGFSAFLPEVEWEKIRNNKSFSYPSGHTAMAYFVANILANDKPGIRGDLETIAAMIGQSRIDNGVHYPTDVSFGRYIGELAADRLLNGSDKVTGTSMLSEREVCDFFKKKSAADEDYISDLASFLHRSNEIERYHLDYGACLDASRKFIQGYPEEYCTNNKYIRSHLSALRKSAAFGKIDTFEKILAVHKSLGDDVIENDLGAGALRNFKHASRSGVNYPNPYQITAHLDSFIKNTSQTSPWDHHVYYEWIHPFCDGNGRSGRIILANELDYDFKNIMDLIGDNYLPDIIHGTNLVALANQA